MGNQNMKLWVGIGACVLAGSTAAAAADADRPGPPQTHAAPTLVASASDYESDGGEAGGEGGEAGAGGEGGEGGEAAAGGEGGEGGEAAAGGEGGEGGEAAGACATGAGGEGGEGGEAAAGGEGGEGGEAAAGGEGGEGGEAAAGGEGGEGGSGPMSVFGSGGEGGGEGGEGGEAASYGPSATESAGVYYTQLALMLGHMEVGRALYEAGQPGIASTHMGHPAAEHLPAVGAALTQRGLEETCGRIQELARTATGDPDWSAVQPAYEAAAEAIRGAMADVPEARRQDPAFLARVLTAMLYQARHEYEQAIDDGAFVADHEYHDSWGFVQVGRRLLEDNAAAFEAADADAYGDLVERYEAVMAAWPTPTVPDSPPLSVSELYGRISAFELAAGSYS